MKGQTMAADLEQLVVETRKMLARVQRKCTRRQIEGYDATDEWLSDLDDVVLRLDRSVTHQDVVTMVEAIQTARWKQFLDTWPSVVWQGTDIGACTRLLRYIYKDGGPRAIQRLVGKPGDFRIVISVEGNVEYGHAVVAAFYEAERRGIAG
jgi:hypothetical protein